MSLIWVHENEMTRNGKRILDGNPGYLYFCFRYSVTHIITYIIIYINLYRLILIIDHHNIFIIFNHVEVYR